MHEPRQKLSRLIVTVLTVQCCSCLCLSRGGLDQTKKCTTSLSDVSGYGISDVDLFF